MNINPSNPHQYLKNWHLDWPLLLGLLIFIGLGLIILFSASQQNPSLFKKQLIHISLSLTILIIFAQIPPRHYYRWAPWIFSLGLTGLFMVLLLGVIGKGAQRWLVIGPFHFEPSEIMKIATPMMLARLLHTKQLPPSIPIVGICGLLIIIPAILIAKQPDLGTALMVAFTGGVVLILSGLSRQIIGCIMATNLVSLPILWHFMHDYQRKRVLTFLNPERDPLGSGYHIIQSKIAIGSGGILGKGWLQGTQAHLNFLPERTTDFIFAVSGEEFGFIGSVILLTLALLITWRGLYISSQAQTTFTRLLSGSLCLMFFLSVFVNISMVTGLLPVVGLPLPFISYGGTAMLSSMAGFGILMSIHTHRQLLDS